MFNDIRETLQGVKKAHSSLCILNRYQECNGVQRHDNTSYIWGCYHTITTHAIHVHRGTTSTVYFICKSKTNKTGLTLVDTRSSRRQLITKITNMKKVKKGWSTYGPLGHIIADGEKFCRLSYCIELTVYLIWHFPIKQT